MGYSKYICRILTQSITRELIPHSELSFLVSDKDFERAFENYHYFEVSHDYVLKLQT